MALHARGARPDDYDTFVRLFAELATGDPIPERARWEAAMAPGIRFFHEGGGEDGSEAGAIVAYSFHQVLDEVGYVRHVVVDPAQRGKRYGRAVMDALAAVFREAGCARWELNVKPDNAAAIALYRSVGMRPAYLSTALRIAWGDVPGLPAASREVTARVAAPDEDGALEAAFGLPAGTLLAARKVPDRVIVRLVDAAAPAAARVGVASFDPHFPGAFPFRVADPTFARALLEGIRPHARPGDSQVGVVVEDDAALVALLAAHGAKAHLEIVHYAGDL